LENITNYLIRSTVTNSEVRTWEEDVKLPTYGIGKEEKNPIFLEKRVYQGSSGSVYPYPVIEKIEDVKKDKLYHAVFLENEYIKLMFLPELGGRVQMAYDKVKKRHFIYYNQVIKPALVGLTGPWISGGIEFNWPQHHRPSTFLPSEYKIEKNDDGSCTVWCSEVERMCRTKGMTGFRLYPGKAYLEINVKLYNRTPLTQTFLWWANPAVVVNKDYHSVFPPDVHAVFDHGKRDVSDFPIATGTYYKHDYSAGVDISKYRNIPVPTSYMAIKSKYDFVGGYDEGVQAGLLHVANHHISPGKKQWTWGNGDFGQAWDRNLTDEDGPYIELMTGVYADNQPDFSFLQPYEEKSWKQYFMPYSEVGYVKNATKDVLINLTVNGKKADVVLYTTSAFSNLRVILRNTKGKILLDKRINTSPAAPFKQQVESEQMPKAEDLILEIFDNDGCKIVSYQQDKPEIKPLPNPAVAIKHPKEIAGIEKLYLAGLHLEQYHHATYQPIDYYKEGLKRDPEDIRCNNALGLLLMRKGQFEKAESYFKTAIKTQTALQPNPYDGEPYYNLGWSLKMQAKLDEAYDAFFKSTWNAAWQDAGYLGVAQIDTMRGHYKEALEYVDRSLIRNLHNHKARHLKTALLRKTDALKEALQLAEDSLEIDHFNMGCLYEKAIILGAMGKVNDSQKAKQELKRLMNDAVHSYLEYAYDYSAAGLYAEAFDILQKYVADKEDVYPMVYYSMGYFASKVGDHKNATLFFDLASKMKPDYCFPNKLEEVIVLKEVNKVNPKDSKAWYYLGNFWYAARQYDEAIDCWTKSGKLNNEFPTVLRNLALAYYNKKGNQKRAVEYMEKAFLLDKSDSRIFMELDQLYKKLHRPYQERLDRFDAYPQLVDERDDMCIERITLYNQLGKYEVARQLLETRWFHPWEGGEGKVVRQYIICLMEPAKQAIAAGDYKKAINLLHATESYPHNLGEGKLEGAEENDTFYFLGVALRAIGKEQEAISYFERATKGMSEPQQAFFYNDQQPDRIFYQGLAFMALGNEESANDRFNKLIAYGKKHLLDECEIDYFAVSLPDLAIWEDDLNVRNRVNCNYLIGLGELGLQKKEQAIHFLSEAIALDNNHQGVEIHLEMSKVL